MTRHQGYDIRVAPEVKEQIRQLGLQRRRESRQAVSALDRLAHEGTRAAGASKLRGLDLWEVRAGQIRLFFSPVPRSRRIAVGAMVVKKTKRLRMARLRHLESVTHRWRTEVENER